MKKRKIYIPLGPNTPEGEGERGYLVKSENGKIEAEYSIFTGGGGECKYTYNFENISELVEFFEAEGVLKEITIELLFKLLYL